MMVDSCAWPLAWTAGPMLCWKRTWAIQHHGRLTAWILASLSVGNEAYAPVSVWTRKSSMEKCTSSCGGRRSGVLSASAPEPH